ncbi:hypothetical protein SCUP234_13440, partial [Seiridium cupressi]
PPSAPAFDTSGGISTRSPGYSTNRCRCASRNVPARMSRTGAMRIIGTLSPRIRRASGRSVSTPWATATTASATDSAAT